MTISLIWAMTQDRVIGIDNKMPWHLPNDMAFFRKQTVGKTVVMGRKTFESLGCKPLPKRHNIVLTRNSEWTHEGVDVLHTVEEVLSIAEKEDLMIIGGAEIYALFMPYADRLYITRIEASIDGDAYFPTYNEDEWALVEEIQGVIDERNLYPHRFMIYERKH